MDRLRDFGKIIGAWIGRMTASQVMMLFGLVAGTIVGAVLMVGWLSDTTYSRLYSDLNESEAGEVVRYLGDNNIPFRLTDGGRTVMVPSDDVYQARISLATEGLPKQGNIGYSIFDQNSLGMTDFLQKINFRRALEGELTRTIMELSEVQAARVHIVMPKERLFKDDQKRATASIVLKLRGNGLSKQQINGISHLVASSVEGLEPGNIAIIDYSGNLLSSGQETDVVAGLTASQLDVRKQVEAYLEHKAQSMLDGVLGLDKSVVRVTADLNFQQLERTSETYDPNTPSIRSEERTKTSSTLSDKSDEASESNEDGSSETTITNYELNKTSEHLIDAVGSIGRLSLAVLIDGTYSPVENENGETTMVYQPRPQDELDRLAAIVKNSVGFDAQRNDQIEMVNLAFDRQDFVQDRLALDLIYQREFYMDVAKKVGYALLMLFAFFYVKKKASKLLTTLGQLMPPPPKQAPLVINRVEEEEESEPIVMENRKPRLVDKMQETAKQEPEELARVIKTMMVE